MGCFNTGIEVAEYLSVSQSQSQILGEAEMKKNRKLKKIEEEKYILNSSEFYKPQENPTDAKTAVECESVGKCVCVCVPSSPHMIVCFRGMNVE